jgi:hypothetical protein
MLSRVEHYSVKEFHVSCCINERAALFLVGLSMKLAAAMPLMPPKEPDAGARAPMSVSADNATSDQKDAPPVTPSREARTQGFQLSLLVGLEVTASASYAYDTSVGLPGVDWLRYNGRQRSPGLALFAGGQLTLPGSLRRITIGADINAGGPDTKDRLVIPAGVSTPFSKSSLYSDIQARYSYRSVWKGAICPFIEHDIGLFHGNRVRAGYQRWDQVGSQSGYFPLTGHSALANYDVRLNLRSHLLRVSVNNYLALKDDTENSHRYKRLSGVIQQWGGMIGTHQTIVIFAAIGPFWQIAP